MKDGHGPSDAIRIAQEMHRQEMAEGGISDLQPTDEPNFGDVGDFGAHDDDVETAGAASGGVLSSASRNAMKSSAFALPGKRAYPLPDISHARNALARASGKSVEGKVRAAVHKKFPSIGKAK